MEFGVYQFIMYCNNRFTIPKPCGFPRD